MDSENSTDEVPVARPLKVVALLLLVLSTILLLVCLSSTTWFSSLGFRTGLFEECLDKEGTTTPLPSNAPAPGSCQVISSRGDVYPPVVAALVVIGTLLGLVSSVLTGIGLSSSAHARKTLFYKFALYLSLFAVVLILVGLVTFPICFYVTLKTLGRPVWNFEWCYGVCWAAALLQFAAALLLLCDRENPEIYYKEKSILHNNNEPSVSETTPTLKSSVKV